jgi:hypothetical protein
MANLVTFDEFDIGGRPQGGTIREIVLSEVTNVVSRRRPLMANLENTSVDSTFVESLEDTFRSRALNATQEGVAATNPDLTQPTRIFFHVQSFADWGVVSDEQRLTAHYNEDPFVYQSRKVLTQVMNDIEHAMHRGSAASGETNVARQFDGLLNIATGLNTTDSSGTTYTESVLVDHLQVFRDQNFDIVPTQAYVNSWLKRTISEFSTKITRNVDAADRTQILVVERHTSDFGDIDVFYTEDQLKSDTKTTSGNSVVYIDPRFLMKGWFRTPMLEQLSRDGLRDRFQINAQCTLMYKTAKAVGSATNYVPFITTV